MPSMVEEQIPKKYNNLTMELASFINKTTFSDLPKEVVEKAKLHIRDGLGNQLAASKISESAKIAMELIKEFGGAQQAPVVGYGTLLPLPFANMINAMLGHGVELDDAHSSALTKAGCVLVPTALGTGYYLKKSGKEIITALVVGYDVSIRIGQSINPGHRKRGYHTSGTANTFGAAAVVSKLLDLDVEHTAWALGLAGMQAAGIQAYLTDPCLAKPFSPGKAAFNGTLAALLASKGLSGPRKILEGEEGFFKAYTDEVRWSAFDDLGLKFKIMEVGFKPHAACRYAHGPIDAAQIIFEKYRPRLEDIKEINVKMSPLAIRQSGKKNLQNLNMAMGSTPFGVVLALYSGKNNLNDYIEGFNNELLRKMTSNVNLIPIDWDGEAGRSAEVEVILKDGQKFVHRVKGPKGDPDNPMTNEELKIKFEGLARLALSNEDVEILNSNLMRFEQLPNVLDIMEIVSGRPKR